MFFFDVVGGLRLADLGAGGAVGEDGGADADLVDDAVLFAFEAVEDDGVGRGGGVCGGEVGVLPCHLLLGVDGHGAEEAAVGCEDLRVEGKSAVVTDGNGAGKERSGKEKREDFFN